MIFIITIVHKKKCFGNEVTSIVVCFSPFAVKLNPFSSPMAYLIQPVLIPGYPGLDGTLIHHTLARSRCWYSFTFPGRMEW